jgi:integrase
MQTVAESPARKRSKDPDKPGYRPLVTPEDFRKRKDSANRVLNLLLAALNQALDMRRVACDGSEWKSVKPYENVRKARIRFLSVTDQARLVNACEGDFKALVRAALFTGCRASELGRLQVMDYNPTSGTVFIAESKSGKSRHIVLTEEGQAFFASCAIGKGATEPLLNRTGVNRTKRVGRDTYWEAGDQCRMIEDACKVAGLDKVVFHELRHSYASALVNAGVPLVYVANQLGHADTTQVEKTYGHLAPTDMSATIRKLAPKLGIFTGEANVAELKIQANVQ